MALARRAWGWTEPRWLLRSFLPHADQFTADCLWERKQYLKWANYLLVEYQLARGHSLAVGQPYWLTVDPTTFCQLQCPFCPTGAGRGLRDRASLKLEHFERLLARLGPLAIHLDLMNWGEPLLNKDLPRMIACAKRYQLEVRVNTNLNDLSDAMAEALVLSGLDVLNVSIDGATQESYETYRVRGNFDKVLENVRLMARKKTELASAAPSLIWQFLVFKHNEHEIERAQAMANELGIEIRFIAPFMSNEPNVLAAWLPSRAQYQLYSPASSGTPVAANPLEVVRIQQTVPSRSYQARRFNPRQLYRIGYLRRHARGDVWRRAWNAFRTSAATAPAVPYTNAPTARLCKWPWAGIAIAANGSAAPCCNVENQNDDFGNIFKRSFSGLWNGSKYRQSRRHVARYVRGRENILPDSDHVCERCTAIGYANFRFAGEAVPGEQP